ncbi:putative uncharacterized protein [Firmicutes bacterium CAG:449]|nr:putative uncharacterized protein [Firmicutes bacterium CAG:449]
MKEITSTKNPLIKELLELKKSSIKKQKQMFLVDGEDFIFLAHEKKLLKMILTLSYQEKYDDVEQIIVTKPILDKLSSNVNSSSMIGVCSFFIQKEIIGNKLIYLDGVQDPGNVGTIIRTALAFNYDGVILSNDTASIYNDKVISSTKGALFKIPLYLDVNINELKDKYCLVATSLHNALNYKEFKNRDKFILILGNEGQGVKKEIIEIASYNVKIPMDNIDSLNVAIAGGILMNEYR